MTGRVTARLQRTLTAVTLDIWRHYIVTTGGMAEFAAMHRHLVTKATEREDMPRSGISDQWTPAPAVPNPETEHVDRSCGPACRLIGCICVWLWQLKKPGGVKR